MKKLRNALLATAVAVGTVGAAAPSAQATTFSWGWKSDTVVVVDSTSHKKATADAVSQLNVEQPYLRFVSARSCPAGANCIDFDAHGGDSSWFAHAHLNGGHSCTVSWNTKFGKKSVSHDRRVIAAKHEIGHCIGLAHPWLDPEQPGLIVNGCDSREPASIMTRNLGCAAPALTEYDLADLASLYEGVYSNEGGSAGDGSSGGGKDKGPDHPGNNPGKGKDKGPDHPSNNPGKGKNK